MIDEAAKTNTSFKENNNLNKRRYLRSPILVTKVKAEQNGKVFFGYAKNVSKVGIFIQTVNPKDEGERFKLEFQLPGGGETITCTAEVVWKRSYHPSEEYEPGMGLRFIDISEEISAKIDKWANIQ